MGMKEEFSPKRRMGTGMRNILDNGVRGVKVSPVNLCPVDIPAYNLVEINDEYQLFFLLK
jgi:hypothetical protein